MALEHSGVLGSSICLPWGRGVGCPQPAAAWQGNATLLPSCSPQCCLLCCLASLGKVCESVCAPAAMSTVPPFPQLWQGAVTHAGAQP